MRWTLAAAIAVALLASGIVASPSAGQGPVSASMMVDFGTGRVLWANVALPEGSSAWNATVAAASILALSLNVTYFDGQPFINDIGQMRPAFPDYWHFLVWGGSRWELAATGPATMPLSGGDVLGWYLTRDAPWNFTGEWPGPRPEASPMQDGRYPVQMFRYDLEGRGVAPGPGPADPEVSWSYDTGAFEISATPAFSRGTIYLSTWTGFIALNESSGALLWRNSGVAGSSSPALFDRNIYVGGRDGALHVLSSANGTELWTVTLQPNTQFSGITSSPRIAYGRVYVGTFNETGGDGVFASIDLYTHETVWSRNVSSVHLSSAAISDYTAYVGLMGRFVPEQLAFDPPYGLLALDAETGAERWFVATNGSVASSPAVSGDLVFVTTRAGEVFAIGTDGQVRWRVATALGSIASPALTSDSVVVGFGVLGTTGVVQAMSRFGDVRWTASLPGPVSASPTVAGDSVYAATNDASGTVHRLTLSDGVERWAREPAPSDYVLSSPVIHNGALYIASDNGLLYRYADRPGPPSFFESYWIPLSLVAGGAAIGAALFILFRVTRRKRDGP